MSFNTIWRDAHFEFFHLLEFVCIDVHIEFVRFLSSKWGCMALLCMLLCEKQRNTKHDTKQHAQPCQHAHVYHTELLHIFIALAHSMHNVFTSCQCIAGFTLQTLLENTGRSVQKAWLVFDPIAHGAWGLDVLVSPLHCIALHCIVLYYVIYGRKHACTYLLVGR